MNQGGNLFFLVVGILMIVGGVFMLPTYSNAVVWIGFIPVPGTLAVGAVIIFGVVGVIRSVVMMMQSK